MRTRLVAAAALLAMCMSLPSGLALAGDVTLVPHRAVYEITVDKVRGGAGIADMTGRMVYELTGNACDGYTQTMRFVSTVVNQDGNSSLTDLRTSSWEDAAARSFRFNTTQYKDRKLSETTTGDAARVAGNGGIKVSLTEPSRKQVELPRGVMFPVQHSRALLEAAQRGVTVFPADLYDGSEKGEKVYATVSYIGRPRAPGNMQGLADVPAAKPLERLRAWPVSISYFEPGSEKEDALPTYELAFLYYENGVSRRLLIDYGSFSIRGTLSHIEFLDPGQCPPDTTRR